MGSCERRDRWPALLSLDFFNCSAIPWPLCSLYCESTCYCITVQVYIRESSGCAYKKFWSWSSVRERWEKLWEKLLGDRKSWLKAARHVRRALKAYRHRGPSRGHLGHKRIVANPTTSACPKILLTPPLDCELSIWPCGVRSQVARHASWVMFSKTGQPVDDNDDIPVGCNLVYWVSYISSEHPHQSFTLTQQFSRHVDRSLCARAPRQTIPSKHPPSCLGSLQQPSWCHSHGPQPLRHWVI